ncbi:hypothetical protein BS47DRAFT_1364732 [Hydnum rufescens UP504]|uniref:Uncharacterized protein n=1 Tax=Hydnum rufescens UP504 TaxID=1448309 RepID=A0A9P6DU36_9AGAM|nr:hypothetical protein BS47DRAFT_1364732 [Hydnum rufescens UP504]
MATFDAHVVTFIVCSQPDAYATHAQNAILFGSSKIQQPAEKQFNLKKSLQELFIKLMNEQLDATGISKWHEEAEKVCSTSKPHQQELGRWAVEILVSKFQNGNSCSIKLERWGKDDADDDTAVPLVIDRESATRPTSTRQPKLTLWKPQKAPASAAKSKGIARSTHIQSKPFIDKSDSDSLDFDNPMALALNSPMTSSHSSQSSKQFIISWTKPESCGHDAPWC